MISYFIFSKMRILFLCLPFSSGWWCLWNSSYAQLQKDFFLVLICIYLPNCNTNLPRCKKGYYRYVIFINCFKITSYSSVFIRVLLQSRAHPISSISLNFVMFISEFSNNMFYVISFYTKFNREIPAKECVSLEDASTEL